VRGPCTDARAGPCVPLALPVVRVTPLPCVVDAVEVLERAARLRAEVVLLRRFTPSSSFLSLSLVTLLELLEALDLDALDAEDVGRLDAERLLRSRADVILGAISINMLIYKSFT